MSKERLGANGVWPRVPAFPDSPPRPAGIPRGDHIVLDEDDERILDRVWTEVMGTPPAEAHAADGQAAPGGGAHRQNGANVGAAKRSRKPVPAARQRLWLGLWGPMTESGIHQTLEKRAKLAKVGDIKTHLFRAPSPAPGSPTAGRRAA